MIPGSCRFPYGFLRTGSVSCRFVKEVFALLCNDCPRQCNTDRALRPGFCRCGELPRVCRAAPHFGEEPCISGSRGSGAIFFSGCNLRCVFCQNAEISRVPAGRELNTEAFIDLLHRLSDSGVHNINLVTPTHFTRFCAEALSKAQLTIPVVWNSSGYESAASLKLLEGLVQIYMPDFKYSNADLAGRLSAAPDYPGRTLEAITEMVRQRGSFRVDENGLLSSGVLIRHLILPGQLENTRGVIDTVADSFPSDTVLFSLMGQFTPMPDGGFDGPVSPCENDDAVHYMKLRRLQGYCQDSISAGTEFIPDFDLTGVDP